MNEEISGFGILCGDKRNEYKDVGLGGGERCE